MKAGRPGERRAGKGAGVLAASKDQDRQELALRKR